MKKGKSGKNIDKTRAADATRHTEQLAGPAISKCKVSLKAFIMLYGRQIFTLLFVFLNGLCSNAFAHSPYFGEREYVNNPEFGRIEFAVLNGDGIISADPSQVIVFDSEGYLLAATPLSDAFVIKCGHANFESSCTAYDPLSETLFEPDYSKWVRNMKIIDDGKLWYNAYPEFMDTEYGFRARPATAADILMFEIEGFLDSPTQTILAIIWWTLAFLLVVRMIWQWNCKNRRIASFNKNSIIVNFIGILVFGAMSFLAYYSWMLAPYSLYYFLVVFLIGLSLALFITRPKKNHL